MTQSLFRIRNRAVASEKSVPSRTVNNPSLILFRTPWLFYVLKEDYAPAILRLHKTRPASKTTGLLQAVLLKCISSAFLYFQDVSQDNPVKATSENQGENACNQVFFQKYQEAYQLHEQAYSVFSAY